MGGLEGRRERRHRGRPLALILSWTSMWANLTIREVLAAACFFSPPLWSSRSLARRTRIGGTCLRAQTALVPARRLWDARSFARRRCRTVISVDGVDDKAPRCFSILALTAQLVN